MATATGSQQLSDAVVAFSLQGRFPEDISQLPVVSETNLEPAIDALEKAKEGLQVYQPCPSETHVPCSHYIG